MRIGIVSDIHCNVQGLRLALQHMGPVDELICAGDSIYQFRFSNEVVALLKEVGARVILGNHEDIFLGPHGERARSSPTVDRALLAWLAEQPYRLETRVDGKRLLVVHGSPWEPYYDYIYPRSPVLARFREIESDYVILGHTHYQMAERVGSRLVINPGSAGEPRDHRNGFQLTCAVLDTVEDRVTFIDYPDPTRVVAATSQG